jgi:predicted nuclease of restriction endonuclease-like (RecB) superfamily
MSNDALRLPSDYDDLLRDLKARIEGAQIRAALAANRELVLLYWQIGRAILARQDAAGWGSKVVDRLAHDLQRAFPELKGFSRRNLQYMRSFAAAWTDEVIVQQVAAQLPWFHNCVLLDKVADHEERNWYVRQAVEHGWSRNVLVHQIERGQGRALTNFTRTLPAPQSDLAQQVLKDPYTFDFLSLSAAAQERDLERGLLAHIRAFLLELGVGFSFVGSQVHLEVGDQDFYLDLLFYHLRLRCFVVLDLKIGEFKPEDAGKMNFYLAVVDDQLRHPTDSPSVGLILCKSKNQIIVEYALRDMQKPIGVSAYQLTHALPEHLRGSLPTIEELEATLAEVRDEGDEAAAS